MALYTNDLAKAEATLTGLLAMPGNQNDPFMHCLLAMTYERQGQAAKARELYQKAYDLATGHNPPAVFARPFARAKLRGLAGRRGAISSRSIPGSGGFVPQGRGSDTTIVAFEATGTIHN